MTDASPTACRRALDLHRERWGSADFVARAPGRVNLIGEHTDYNDGFVLPMAIPFETAIVVSAARGGGDTEVESEGFGRALLGDGSTPGVRGPDWAMHIRGVRDLLAGEGVEAPPWRATIATDVPIGASLSSSAALEVATALAIIRLGGAEMSSVDLARICQRVENEVLGLPSGIMDQLISATATEGNVTLIDCRSLDARSLPLPEDVAVVIMDSGTRRTLVDSEFAARRASCVRACELLGVSSLRDASGVEGLPDGHDIERRRARHVISENARTLAAFAALETGDTLEFGALMGQSHRSLRDDYEVSGPALDAIVDLAGQTSGCLGARMTGGGFAGCAVALVSVPAVPEFIDSVSERYRVATGATAQMWTCRPAAGARIDEIADSGDADIADGLEADADHMAEGIEAKGTG